MQHLKGFGLENFRVFKDYTWFDFAPITLLIGPNNSGKSSLIKALLLLKENIKNGSLSSSLDFKSTLHNLSGWDGVINDKTHDVISFEYSTSAVYHNFSISNPFENIFTAAIGNAYLKGIITKYEYRNNESHYYFHNSNTKHECVASFSKKDELYIDSQHLFLSIEIVLDKIGNNKEKYLLEENEDVFFKTKLKETELDKWINILRSFSSFIKKQENWKIDLNEVFMQWKQNNLEEAFDNFLQQHEAYYCDFPNTNLLISVQYVFNDFSPKVSSEDFNLLMQIIAFIINHEANNPTSIFNLKYLPAIKVEQKSVYLKGDNHPLAILTEENLRKKQSQAKFIQKWGEKFGISEFTTGRDENSRSNYITVNDRKLEDLGYGISQLASVILSFGEEEILILEEPESNLHPKFQSLLADLFTEQLYETKLIGSREGENEVPKSVQFIIETHSEYMVRKFQYLVKKKEMRKEDIVIYYFHDPKENKQPTKIEIQEDGRLSQPFGSGFYDETSILISALLTGENLN